MSLIQRYTTELSAHAGTNSHDGTSIAHIVNNFENIKRQDEDEKRYFNSLNDRLEELLRSLENLELANKSLRDELNHLITSWGIDGENRHRFLQELHQITGHLSDQHRRKVLAEVETKLFEEQTRMIDRVTAVLLDVYNFYEDKKLLLFDLLKRLEDEYSKILIRLDRSQIQLKTHDDDYQKELAKFRSYLSEWSRIALDKHNLMNEIQTLRELKNLRLAYNQEELNEWKRLLNQILQESDNFYRDYLDTIKQKIQMDYEQMAKEQQNDVELELKTRLKQIQEKIQMGLPIDENDERKRREEMHRFESRLNEQTKQFDHLQSDFRKLAEEVQHKRRILQDLENDLRNRKRRNVEQYTRLENETDRIRDEYYQLKDELDKLAYTLRFSIEEELKIYEALLKSLEREKDAGRSSIDQSTGFGTIKKPTEIESSKKYRQNVEPNQADLLKHMLGQNQMSTTTKTTTKRVTRRAGHENDEQQQQQQIKISRHRNEAEIEPELDEKYLQQKVRITRKYRGNILIKFVDVNGRFVDIENTGNSSRDITGWYIKRNVDGRNLEYTFPVFELDAHKTVRIYGNYHKRSSSSHDEEVFVELIASNFYDWGTGEQMYTELFNQNDASKATFEQTLIHD